MFKDILRSIAWRILDKELRENWIQRSHFNEYTQWMSRDFPVKGLGEKAAVVQPVINIHTLPGETADVSWNNGELDVRIRKIAREEDKRTWGNLGNPNSFEAKQIQRNTTAGVKR